MKYIFHEELIERLPGILGLLRELSGRVSGLEYLETLLRYIVVAGERVSESNLREVITSVFTEEGGETMATLAEQWIEQGRQ